MNKQNEWEKRAKDLIKQFSADPEVIMKGVHIIGSIVMDYQKPQITNKDWGWLVDLTEQYPSSAHPTFIDTVISHISNDFISKKHLESVLFCMLKTSPNPLKRDLVHNKVEAKHMDFNNGYNSALKDLKKELL